MRLAPGTLHMPMACHACLLWLRPRGWKVTACHGCDRSWRACSARHDGAQHAAPLPPALAPASALCGRRRPRYCVRRLHGLASGGGCGISGSSVTSWRAVPVAAWGWAWAVAAWQRWSAGRREMTARAGQGFSFLQGHPLQRAGGSSLAMRACARCAAGGSGARRRVGPLHVRVDNR